MRGGRPAGRILLAVALVALPLIALAVLRDAGSPGLPGSPLEDAVLRLVPGQGGDARAVRPGPDAEAGAHGALATRDLALLAVLLATVGAVALAATWCGSPPAVATVRRGRRAAASGRGPPSTFPR